MTMRNIYRLLGAALLLAVVPGCFIKVEEPKPKKMVDVKIDRNGKGGIDVNVDRDGKGVDVDVDVRPPARP